MDLYKNGQHLDALKELTILLEKNKHTPECVKEYGDAITDIIDNPNTMPDENFIQWITKEATNGSSFAQNNLGFMYKNGYGVAKDASRAYHWYQLSSNQNNYIAQSNLALMYQMGDGVPLDRNKARKLAKLSADKGHDTAQNTLGNLYFGMDQFDMAFKWYTLSAAQNHPMGLKNLAEMYGRGLGCKKDVKKALKLYYQSMKYGYTKAREDIRHILCNSKNNNIIKDICDKNLNYDELKQRVEERNNILQKINGVEYEEVEVPITVVI